MLGAIIGDIAGSTREWHNIKTEDFELIPADSFFTDDSVMTLAVAEWLMEDPQHREETLVASMQRLGRKYPDAGYGKMFSKWLTGNNPQPYGSYGNGSAMRVSPVGLYARTLEECLALARTTAIVSHNHPDAIAGAQAVAAAIFLRVHWWDGEEIKQYIEEKFGYDLSPRLEVIRPSYSFHVSCKGSVPIALMAFLQREDNAEAALRLAISMGGDSDTIGCMTCSIAASRAYFYEGHSGISAADEEKCRRLLPDDPLSINDRFEEFVGQRIRGGRRAKETVGQREIRDRIILAIGNDLATSCVVSEYAAKDTPEQQLRYRRYVDHKPSGI